MPIPQVNDRIKEAPVVVLRAVFAGIGQILLTADKVRARAAEQVLTPDRGPISSLSDRHPPEPPPNGTEPAVANHSALREAPTSRDAVTAETAPTATATPPAKATPTAKATPAAKAKTTAKATRAAKPARGAKATPTTKSEPAAKATSAAKAGPATKSAPEGKAARAAKTGTATKAAKAGPAPRAAKAKPTAQAPPLPGYDDLSIASLRARLRVLDGPTIQAMLAYENAHARREPVIAMLERRLAKISAG